MPVTTDRWNALGDRLVQLRQGLTSLPHNPALVADKSEGLAEALELHEQMTPLAHSDVDMAWREYRAALSRRARYAEGAHREGLRIASDAVLGMSV